MNYCNGDMIMMIVATIVAILLVAIATVRKLKAVSELRAFRERINDDSTSEDEVVLETRRCFVRVLAELKERPTRSKFISRRAYRRAKEATHCKFVRVLAELVSSKSTVQKQFHFSLSSNETFFIPHVSDLSDEEVKATWYERGNDGKSATPLIRKMMNGATIEETDKETFRGLEYRTHQGAIRRQQNKDEAISAVLDEQDRQMKVDGKVDDEILAAVYRQINAHCQEEAHQLALGDVEPAREHAADATGKIIRRVQNQSRALEATICSFERVLAELKERPTRSKFISRRAYRRAKEATCCKFVRVLAELKERPTRSKFISRRAYHRAKEATRCKFVRVLAALNEKRRAPVRNKCSAAQAIPSRRSPRLAVLSAVAEPIAAVVVEARRCLPHVRSRAPVCYKGMC